MRLGNAVGSGVVALPPDSGLSESDSVFLRSLYYRTEAEFAARNGDTGVAVAAYRNALSLFLRAYDSISDPRERVAWLHVIRECYRGLTGLYLFVEHDPAKAFDTWEQYEAVSAAAPLPSNRTHVDSGTVITYVAFPNGVAIWAERDRKREFSFAAVPARALEQQITELHELCSDPAGQPEALMRVARPLTSLLLKPVMDKLTDSRLVSIQAEGELADIPFPLLFTTARLTAPVTILSAAAQNPTPTVFDSRKTLFAIVTGSSTAGAPERPIRFADEVNSIASRFPHTSVLSSESGMGAFKDALRDADIVHYTGHAVQRSGAPALILTADGDRDVYLAASSLKGFPARARLVVLAGCSTAQRESGEQASLSAALLRLGVRDVMVTLWAVDDASASALMKSFYTHLTEGEPPALALYSAQQDLRKTNLWRHPYYWAPYIIYSRN